MKSSPCELNSLVDIETGGVDLSNLRNKGIKD